MTTTSDTINGMPLDEGTAFFVKESAQGDGVAAIISKVQLQTSKFAGAYARREFIVPQMTTQRYGLQAAENHVPDIRLAYNEFLDASDPIEGIKHLDDVLSFCGGTSSASAFRIIPAETILQSAYKAADGLAGATYGIWDYAGFSKARTRDNVPIYPKMVTVDDLRDLQLSGLDADSIMWLTPPEQAVMKEMNDIYSFWEATHQGQLLTDDNVNSVIVKLGVVVSTDDWRSADLLIAEDGSLLAKFGAEKPVFIDSGNVSKFLPHVKYSSSKKVKYLDDAVVAHNRWVKSLPKVNDIVRVKSVDVIKSSATITGVGVAAEVLGLVNDPNFKLGDVALQEKVVQEALDRSDKAVFMLIVDDVPDFVTIPVTPDDTDETLAIKAYAMLSSTHKRIALRIKSAHASADNFIKARKRIVAQEALIPAFAARVQTMRVALQNAPAPHHITLPEGDVKDYDTLCLLMDDIGEIVESYREHGFQAVNTGTPHDKGYTIITAGRYAPTESEAVILVPVTGRGVAPVRIHYLPNGKYEMDKALGAAVILEEPAVTVESPVRAMIMTAALMDLIAIFEGRAHGSARVDEYDPHDPCGDGITAADSGRPLRPCAKTICQRQMRTYARGLAQQISNATPDNITGLLKKASVFTDAKLFLDSVDELYDAIIDRDDWVFMIQGMLISMLMQEGWTVTQDGTNITTVSAGIAPPTITRFLFDEVLTKVIQTDAYKRVAQQALSRRFMSVPDLTDASEVNRLVRSEIMLNRMRRGVKFLATLFDGSDELCPIVPVGDLQRMSDVMQFARLINAIAGLMDRDYLASVDAARLEAPWKQAHWNTQFTTMGITTKLTPIEYQAHDIANEISDDSGIPQLATAIRDTGFEWTEIAPTASFVRANAERQIVLEDGLYMEGAGGDGGLYNDAPVSHQMLRLTTVLPMYDKESYNLLKMYATTATARTYWVQPVGDEISAQYHMEAGESTDPSVAHILGMDPEGLDWDNFVRTGFDFEKCPALHETALVVPYISDFLVKPAETSEMQMTQCIEIDNEASLAVTSGVTLTTGHRNDRLISYGNGLAVDMKVVKSMSTALDWIGS